MDARQLALMFSRLGDREVKVRKVTSGVTEFNDFSVSIEKQGLFDTSNYKGMRNAIDWDLKIWLNLEDPNIHRDWKEKFGDPIETREIVVLTE